ncbi:hypothetical protein [Bradyrhizobium sp. WSM471]|uniref:hypothetical protein n=1 Tax=Bradyrhizobium sp. WSM471 TaxID=319017 RepID=UPI00024D1B9F|nr:MULTISPECIES: hypothetical protein [Bradyrhizobium]EHR00251.1 hypothetical protein Bra471DRAFT_00811 [Bradyrhizobium sp. WSM471]UFW42370.1 hypothetical protein BcanWSM471_03960 [Bradyrhizobium canariense]
MTALQDYLKRKEDELRWKLLSLPDELKVWREQSAERHALQKNHSQISRLSLRLEGLQNLVTVAVDQAIRADELWLRAESLEKKALVVHTVWDQFRNRLCLRLVPPFDSYLALADAYARDCYIPVHRQLRGLASDQLCPAPLVTFDEQSTPYMEPGRDADGDDDGLPTPQQFQDALDRLPLTLIKIPWSYLSYLPHMALLAHEMGHALERSAGLTDALDQAIARAAFATDLSRQAWQAWRKEAFADWYGCAMGGPPFVAALADHLANDPPRILRQKRPQQNGDWTSYPTATVRILFCCYGLRVLGFADEANKFEGGWSQAYPSNEMADFVADFETVISAFSGVCDLTQNAYGNFKPAVWNTSVAIANLYRQGGELPNDQPKPPRAYVGAARLLMEQPPQAYPVKLLWSKLREHHLATRPDGVAGDEEVKAIDDGAAQEIDQLAAILFENM